MLVQIAFRNTAPSEEIETYIRRKADKLGRFYDRITSCRVLVEAPAHHRRQGHPFHVRIELTVPEGEIVVNRESDSYPGRRSLTEVLRRGGMATGPRRKYLRTAIREAFDAARRQLQDHTRRLRTDVKKHEPMPYGRVIKLFPQNDYGYLETSDGAEIYFHAHSVLNGRFKDLKLGAKVRFVPEAGERGVQASTVQLVTRTRPQTALPPARKTA